MMSTTRKRQRTSSIVDDTLLLTTIDGSGKNALSAMAVARKAKRSKNTRANRKKIAKTKAKAKKIDQQQQDEKEEKSEETAFVGSNLGSTVSKHLDDINPPITVKDNKSVKKLKTLYTGKQCAWCFRIDDIIIECLDRDCTEILCSDCAPGRHNLCWLHEYKQREKEREKEKDVIVKKLKQKKPSKTRIDDITESKDDIKRKDTTPKDTPKVKVVIVSSSMGKPQVHNKNSQKLAKSTSDNGDTEQVSTIVEQSDDDTPEENVCINCGEDDCVSCGDDALLTTLVKQLIKQPWRVYVWSANMRLCVIEASESEINKILGSMKKKGAASDMQRICQREQQQSIDSLSHESLLITRKTKDGLSHYRYLVSVIIMIM
jgi:hypothetical protein